MTSDTLASAAVGVTNVVGTIIAASLMENAGRKQLLASSFLGQAAAMFYMVAGFTVSSCTGRLRRQLCTQQTRLGVPHN